MSEGELLARVAAAVARHLGAGCRVLEAHPLTGGANSSTWRLDLDIAGDQRQLILRRSSAAGRLSAALDKTTEARVQQAAAAAGVPVAEVAFVLDEQDGLGEGYAMAHLPGESIPRKILRDPAFATARSRMTHQCGEIAAAIHAVEDVDLPLLDAATQLRLFREVYADLGQPLPVFELAMRWLGQRCGPTPRPALVHGDFRLGNFLVDPDSGITAVLDWELAHRGDPLEDLGWLCVNSWRFGARERPVGGFGQRDELFAAYEQASRRPVDPRRVRFWEIFGTLKWGIMCMHMAGGHLRGEERSLEKAAIGRRVSETEYDLLLLLEDADAD